MRSALAVPLYSAGLPAAPRTRGGMAPAAATFTLLSTLTTIFPRAAATYGELLHRGWSPGAQQRHQGGDGADGCELLSVVITV